MLFFLSVQVYIAFDLLPTDCLIHSVVYYRMGDKSNVDTTSFRQAIWNYIHSLFGIRHDDYDYSVVNKLLERPLKAYVKIVTCFPERVTRADYDAFMRDFNHSEKVKHFWFDLFFYSFRNGIKCFGGLLVLACTVLCHVMLSHIEICQLLLAPVIASTKLPFFVASCES